MIDEKFLKEWESKVAECGCDTESLCQFHQGLLGRPTELELIRLARLGLWAEKHGIEAVQIANHTASSQDFFELTEEAIAALPSHT